MPQARLHVDCFQNRLALRGCRKNSAGNEVGGLLRIANGIEIA